MRQGGATKTNYSRDKSLTARKLIEFGAWEFSLVMEYLDRIIFLVFEEWCSVKPHMMEIISSGRTTSLHTMNSHDPID